MCLHPCSFHCAPWELGMDEPEHHVWGAEGAVRTIRDLLCTAVQVSSDLSCSLRAEHRPRGILTSGKGNIVLFS